ncbi:MAG: WXG100 family type VII secretion target [Nocardioidaceae bacterium]
MSNTANEMGQGHGTLTKAAGLVAAAKHDLDRVSADLTTKIQGLSTQWVGAGGSAFQRLHAEWTEQHRVITSALNEFEAALTQTERDNMSTDDNQVAPMSNLSARLGG